MTNRLNITKEMKQKDIKYAVKKLTASDVVCMHEDCDSNQLYMVLASAKTGLEVHYFNELGMQRVVVPADMPTTVNKVKEYMKTKEEVTMKPVDQLTVAENVEQVMENPNAVLDMDAISEEAKDLNTFISEQANHAASLTCINKGCDNPRVPYADGEMSPYCSKECQEAVESQEQTNNEEEESKMTQVKEKVNQVKESITSSKFTSFIKSTFSEAVRITGDLTKAVGGFVKRHWKQSTVGAVCAVVAGTVTPGVASAFFLGTAMYATGLYLKARRELIAEGYVPSKKFLIPASLLIASTYVGLGTIAVLTIGLAVSTITTFAGLYSLVGFISATNIILA